MLILNEELWEKDRIVKIYCSSNWEKDDNFIMNDCVLQRLKQLLIEAEETDKEGILICDFNKGTFPPMTQALQIVAFMVSIKNQIENGLLCTIIYAKSEEHKKWVGNILKIYNHIKPIYVVSTKEEIKSHLLQQQVC